MKGNGVVAKLLFLILCMNFSYYCNIIYLIIIIIKVFDVIFDVITIRKWVFISVHINSAVMKIVILITCYFISVKSAVFPI